MKIDTSIKILSEQLELLAGLKTVSQYEVWLQQTGELVKEIFGVHSDYYINLFEITIRFKKKKKSGFELFRTNTELQTLVQEMIHHQKEEKRISLLKDSESPPLTYVLNKKVADETKTEKKISVQKENSHYKIGITLFWSVAIPIAGAFWYFGFYVGTTKFDREKSDMYDENKLLKQLLQTKEDTIKILNANIDTARHQLNALYKQLVNTSKH